MAAIGLIYCGAVLFVNGLMLLGHVSTRSAAILNIFVGALQVVTPTVLILQAGQETTALLNASGIYLFGFTFLYVGIVNVAGLPSDGIGWYSLFVSFAALAYALVNLAVIGDPVFATVWTAWAGLWLLFFLLLGAGLEPLAPHTGWALLLLSQPTTTIPGFLILAGLYSPSSTYAIFLAVALAVLMGLAFVLGQRGALAASSNTEPAHHPRLPADMGEDSDLEPVG
jgi:putative amide transporter protein